MRSRLIIVGVAIVVAAMAVVNIGRQEIVMTTLRERINFQTVNGSV